MSPKINVIISNFNWTVLQGYFELSETVESGNKLDDGLARTTKTKGFGAKKVFCKILVMDLDTTSHLDLPIHTIN